MWIFERKNLLNFVRKRATDLLVLTPVYTVGVCYLLHKVFPIISRHRFMLGVQIVGYLSSPFDNTIRDVTSMTNWVMTFRVQ